MISRIIFQEGNDGAPGKVAQDDLSGPYFPPVNEVLFAIDQEKSHPHQDDQGKKGHQSRKSKEEGFRIQDLLFFDWGIHGF